MVVNLNMESVITCIDFKYFKLRSIVDEINLLTEAKWSVLVAVATGL